MLSVTTVVDESVYTIGGERDTAGAPVQNRDMKLVELTLSSSAALSREFREPFKREAGAEHRAVDAPCSGSQSSVMALLELHPRCPHQ